MSSVNDLRSFIEAANREMSLEYERICARSTEDPGTAGDEGESNWAELLRQWLPAHYHITTKGRVLSWDGVASHQVDVVILRPEYPPALLKKKVYLSSGVVAVFECKLTLRRRDVSKAVRRAAEFQRAQAFKQGTPREDLFSHITYGLLAHSSDIPGRKDDQDPISISLWNAAEEHVQHPRELLDLICVADRQAWFATKHVFRGPRSNDPASHVIHTSQMEASRSDAAASRHLPVGAFLTKALNRLTLEDHRLAAIAGAMNAGGLVPAASGRVRQWEVDCLSPAVRAQLSSHPRSKYTFEDWSLHWP